jgi:type III secretion protein HrpB1
MNPSLQSKQFVKGLIDVVSQGISNDRLEDAEAVLACVRVLRPKLVELDTFEAWISIKRGHWHDAVRTLRSIDSSSPNWALGQALLAFCQFALGDNEWTLNANEVINTSTNREALGLVRLLMGEEISETAVGASPAEANGASLGSPDAMAAAAFMRA